MLRDYFLSQIKMNMQVVKNTLFLNMGISLVACDLVPGSMEVYPIKDYGAIETGLHRFCHEDNGKQDCGTFKFLPAWQKKTGNGK